jgi:hypothetical protein
MEQKAILFHGTCAKQNEFHFHCLGVAYLSDLSNHPSDTDTETTTSETPGGEGASRRQSVRSFSLDGSQ